MKKHTPGPWIIDDFNAKDKYSSVLWYSIKDSIGTKLIEVKGIHYGVNNDEAEANANLTAAAPELLEALLMLMDVYESKGQLLSFNVDIARQAIKKATP